jgi:hypothetical protein
VHADRTSFTGQGLTRIVEPGTITVTLGGSSGDLSLTGSFTLTGPIRTVGIDRVLDSPVSVKKLTDYDGTQPADRADMEVSQWHV